MWRKRAMRWTPTRKAETVIAIEKGSITTEEAKKNYRLSDEELAAWMCNYSVRGLAGLRATKRRHDRSRLPQEAEGVIWHRLASITSPPPQRVTRPCWQDGEARLLRALNTAALPQPPRSRTAPSVCNSDSGQ